jgi:TolA-binding protein
MKIKVKDNPDLVRDVPTGAILSVDNRALHAYKVQKKKMQSIGHIQEQQDSINQRLDSLEQKLDKLIDIIGTDK